MYPFYRPTQNIFYRFLLVHIYNTSSTYMVVPCKYTQRTTSTLLVYTPYSLWISSLLNFQPKAFSYFTWHIQILRHSRDGLKQFLTKPTIIHTKMKIHKALMYNIILSNKFSLYTRINVHTILQCCCIYNSCIRARIERKLIYEILILSHLHPIFSIWYDIKAYIHSILYKITYPKGNQKELCILCFSFYTRTTFITILHRNRKLILCYTL